MPDRDGITQVADLVDAVDNTTILLAVSEVTSREGQRLDLAALREATDRVGARLFVDVTQSLGALDLDLGAAHPDYIGVHGYKWMLCPRGAAWLVTRPDRLDVLTPIAPNWRSTGQLFGYFGAAPALAADARRCDSSPAWFSWIGACAAQPAPRSLATRPRLMRAGIPVHRSSGPRLGEVIATASAEVGNRDPATTCVVPHDPPHW